MHQSFVITLPQPWRIERTLNFGNGLLVNPSPLAICNVVYFVSTALLCLLPSGATFFFHSAHLVAQCGSVLRLEAAKIDCLSNLAWFPAGSGTKPTKLEEMSRTMRKPDFCICENKGADQLCSNCTADQRLCFRYLVSTILLQFQASSLLL